MPTKKTKKVAAVSAAKPRKVVSAIKSGQDSATKVATRGRPLLPIKEHRLRGIVVPVDVHLQLKIAAAERGLSMKDAAVAALQRWIGNVRYPGELRYSGEPAVVKGLDPSSDADPAAVS